MLWVRAKIYFVEKFFTFERVCSILIDAGFSSYDAKRGCGISVRGPGGSTRQVHQNSLLSVARLGILSVSP